MHSTDLTPPVDALPFGLARSWWLVSGSAGLPLSTSESDADAIVLDLEDGVAPGHKHPARTMVTAALAAHRVWVRINDVRSPYWEDDLAAIRDCPNLMGVMVAKTETPADIDAITHDLPAGTPAIAFIETAVGIEAAREIADHSRVCRLAFGSGDFRMDIGAGAHTDALSYARSRLVVVSRAARLPGPIDGPTVTDDHSILERDTAYAASLGMSGRLCLHASHAKSINTTFSPSTEEIVHAQTLIVQLGPDGARATKGSDLPRLAQAHRTLHLAEKFGLA